jgi:hypothetical protein
MAGCGYHDHFSELLPATGCQLSSLEPFHFPFLLERQRIDRCGARLVRAVEAALGDGNGNEVM